MDLLSLRLSFLCPKLSTQGAITCSPKLLYSVPLDPPDNSFLRSVDSTWNTTQAGFVMLVIRVCILTAWYRVSLLQPLFLHRHPSCLLSSPPAANRLWRHRGISDLTDPVCNSRPRKDEGCSDWSPCGDRKQIHSGFSSVISFYPSTPSQTNCNINLLASRLWPITISLTDCCSQNFLYFGVHEPLTSSTLLAPVHGLC